MIDETFKLIAVPTKLRRLNNVDYRKKAFHKSLETYFKKEIDDKLTERIIKITEEEIYEYEEDVKIRLLSHTLVKEILQSCVSKFDR
jgi:uncharacterized HAD superfamily protein|tara:strand:- start:296 stop:556 length:261 start_codon:yes stop_codon:yes gene_type:complete